MELYILNYRNLMNVGVFIFGLKEFFRKRERKGFEFIFNKNEASFIFQELVL